MIIDSFFDRVAIKKAFKNPCALYALRKRKNKDNLLVRPITNDNTIKMET
jgi:hypothetical protein